MGFFSVLAFVVAPGPTAAYHLGKMTKNYISEKIEDGKSKAHAEGIKAGEKEAQQKYESRLNELTTRLRSYHDLDKKIIALYAVGLAVAYADGHIGEEEQRELDCFVAGCAAENLPAHVKDVIAELRLAPPDLERAVQFATTANLSKSDIQDVIDIVTMADGIISEGEKTFISNWNRLAEDLAVA